MLSIRKGSRWVAWVVFGFAVLAFGHPEAVQNEADDPSFYGGDLESAVFVQWTESQGHLSGQYQAAYISGRSVGRLESVNQSFTGIRNGSEVSLTLSGLLGALSTWTGTLRGGQLSLVVPNQAGTLNTLVLKPGTVQDYNRVVETVRQRAGRQAEIAARQRAVSVTYQQTTTLYQGLIETTTRLRRMTNFDDVLSSYAAHQTELLVRNDKLHRDADHQPLRCYQRGQVQADLGAMEATMGGIQADNGRFDYDRRAVLNAIADAQKGAVALRQSFQAFSQAVAADSTNTLSPKFIEDIGSRMDSIVGTSTEQIRWSMATLQQAAAQSNEFNEKTRRLLSEAKDFVSGLTCSD